MTDWTKTTGVNGTMRIRDVGDGWVEFWFKAGYSSDWYNGLKFSWTANGDTTPKSINYPTGADWYKVGWVFISDSQTVTFKLVSDTSISGIGGPTTFSHAIQRDTVPAKPGTPKLTSVNTTTVGVTFTDGSNGGDAINSRQIGYSKTDHVVDGTIISSDGSTTVSGLTPGTKYWFWARTHNSEGYSAWSTAATITTVRVPDAPTTPLLSSVTATTVDVAFSGNGNGGANILGYQVGWSTSQFGPPMVVINGVTSPRVITGLAPGTVYYFSTRAQNIWGYSPWSAPASARTVAGAYIKVGTAWKLAVVYVRVGGVWKKAEPWTRNVGVWKRTV